MSKGIKVLLAVVAVIVIGLIIGAVVFFSTLNKEKAAMTPEEFTSKLEAKGYTISDVTNDFSGYDYVKKVKIAVASDYSHQIEFYQFSEDENYAQSFYVNSKDIFDRTKGDANAETEINGKNYSKYVIATNGKYKIISRIGNTAIYVDADDKSKDKIKEMLKEIGY